MVAIETWLFAMVAIRIATLIETLVETLDEPPPPYRLNFQSSHYL